MGWTVIKSVRNANGQGVIEFDGDRCYRMMTLHRLESTPTVRGYTSIKDAKQSREWRNLIMGGSR